ncbi:MAG TPA: hypothetical protein VMJ13_06835 [Candidatus Acidoferrum sp.]|nr:hypothetical protein [Candidatus Acidoferrum sp.]
MTQICGEVVTLAPPVGGGVHEYRTKYVYADGSPSVVKSSWYKRRMEFPSMCVGKTILDGVYVANDQLGHDIAENIKLGDRVCLFVYGHLLRKKVIIGVKPEKGPSFLMPASGFVSGLFWYAVFSPIIVAIPAAIIGMIVGMLGGQKGTAMGLLFGILYAVGISWFSGFRFYKAYGEMRASSAGRGGQ